MDHLSLKNAALLLIVVIALASPLPGQITASYTAIGNSGVPGGAVSAEVLMTHGAAADAFSFGLAHDPTLLTISNYLVGTSLQGGLGPGLTPDYLLIDTTPRQGMGSSSAA